MDEQLVKRARLLACHAWVFREAEACEYDALLKWHFVQALNEPDFFDELNLFEEDSEE